MPTPETKKQFTPEEIESAKSLCLQWCHHNELSVDSHGFMRILIANFEGGKAVIAVAAQDSNDVKFRVVTRNESNKSIELHGDEKDQVIAQILLDDNFRKNIRVRTKKGLKILQSSLQAPNLKDDTVGSIREGVRKDGYEPISVEALDLEGLEAAANQAASQNPRPVPGPPVPEERRPVHKTPFWTGVVDSTKE